MTSRPRGWAPPWTPINIPLPENLNTQHILEISLVKLSLARCNFVSRVMRLSRPSRRAGRLVSTGRSGPVLEERVCSASSLSLTKQRRFLIRARRHHGPGRPRPRRVPAAAPPRRPLLAVGRSGAAPPAPLWASHRRRATSPGAPAGVQAGRPAGRGRSGAAAAVEGRGG
jgi:hypothetical protein